MCSQVRSTCFGFVSALFLSFYCLASPTNSKLLWLVPSGAQIVAGFENYHDPDHHGQLLLTTRNNRLDLADWQAIAGVDHNRAFEEVIEVAASSIGGRLSDHLLLVAGRFSEETIFKSLELNGAKKVEFKGQTIMLIEPFPREKGLLAGTRWLVILQDRFVMFGTPKMVQAALLRYVNHADSDMILRERLSQLPREVSSWNVLSSMSKSPTQYKASLPSSPWEKFFDGAKVMMVGARFGSKIRLHFSLHASSDRGADFFAQKSRFFAEVFAPERTGGSRLPRLHELEIAPDRVQGSIELSKKQFEAWSDWTNNFGRAPAVPDRTVPSGQ